MRYIIDDMPQDPKDCDLAEFNPYTGRYVCKLDKQVCNMEENERIHWSGCRHLKEL